MMAVPALLPVTTPEVPTEAVPGLALDHVPPLIGCESVVVLPGQTFSVPVMGTGRLTVSTRVVLQPVGKE